MTTVTGVAAATAAAGQRPAAAGIVSSAIAATTAMALRDDLALEHLVVAVKLHCIGRHDNRDSPEKLPLERGEDIHHAVVVDAQLVQIGGDDDAVGGAHESSVRAPRAAVKRSSCLRGAVGGQVDHLADVRVLSQRADELLEAGQALDHLDPAPRPARLDGDADAAGEGARAA